MIAQLNDRWRVVDSPIQWILEYRAGKISHSDESKNRKTWKGKRFCRTRDALIRDIGELCGNVDPAALEVITALPTQNVERTTIG